jgi:serine protease AprX
LFLLLAPGAVAVGGAEAPFVPQALIDSATANPDQVFRVIVQGRPSLSVSTVEAGVEQTQVSAPAVGDGVNGSFSSINAVAAEMTGEQILLLADRTDIFAITPDMPLRASVADPPTALEPPTVTGVAQTNELLSTSTGQWAGAGLTYAYQWQRCDATGAACADIMGADTPTYAVTSDDEGSTLDAVVTATNADGAATSTSATTPVVVAPTPPAQFAPPTTIVSPTIAGIAAAGQTLSADDGVWSGQAVSLTRQWQRCSTAGDACVDVTDATGDSYSVAAEDVGLTLRLVVSGADVNGVGVAMSAPTDVVTSATPAAPPPPTVVTPPTITGTTTAGQTLTATDGTWSAPVESRRQWQRCSATGDACVDISMASASTYVLRWDDIGDTLRVVVIAGDSFGGTTATSAPTAVIAAPSGSSGGSGKNDDPPPVNVTPPAANGDPMATRALSAQPGTWSPVGLSLRFRYRWVRCDASGGGTCTSVGWNRTYTPTNADVGSTLRVVVDADHNGDKGTATSAPTERVAPFTPSGFWSWQLGPYTAGLDAQWTAVSAANATPPAIAVVDSGVDPSLPGLDGTVVKQVPMTTLPQSATPDGYGHGSFVAQVAAGHARGAAGASPTAPIVSLDVMNDDGMALTSDVVAAADWIYAHKAEDNIRVANFSLIGSSPSSIMFDPLDRALEKLWLSGVVVTTAAGNFAVDGQESNIPFSPANDPFVITVGASDTAGTLTPADDFAAPWSAFGHTFDGFAKPELGAPGRYVVASVPTDSTLYTQRPDRVVGPGRLELSGTSFAAPLVAGVAANLLALHPGWTPDQVKGALMLSAKQPGVAAPFALGVGEVDAAAALTISDPPNPNAALEQFLIADPAGGATQVLDTASWGTTAQANASWGTASWGTASWGTASWGTASWGTAYWSSASWGTASWGTASWGTASWGTASWGTDNAAADVLPGGGYPMNWLP